MRDENTPVLIGAGQIIQRDIDPAEALEPLDLMAEAARRAAADAGLAPEALAGLDRALLVGRAAEPATAWDYSSGRVAPRGRYRIVIPVDRAGDPSRPSSSANAQP